ncbi:hypothetical protein SKAU_G00146840 [Synaphobranchus kaupii]|uniref:Uncharacterized protein n=1 Tax=Synaphobranchus kaupii TaxID=118154 RepID=A0A9Q1J4U0_SYNKA|nr:hypothetical protein SKAU_G00146840 [Synaphobranchus kaupii]
MGNRVHAPPPLFDRECTPAPEIGGIGCQFLLPPAALCPPSSQSRVPRRDLRGEGKTVIIVICALTGDIVSYPGAALCSCRVRDRNTVSQVSEIQALASLCRRGLIRKHGVGVCLVRGEARARARCF